MLNRNVANNTRNKCPANMVAKCKYFSVAVNTVSIEGGLG